MIDQLEAQKKTNINMSNGSKTLGRGIVDNTEKQILNKIRTYSVPNTKEDVFEFMILASSNINMSAIMAESPSDAGANSTEELNAMKARNDAWQTKMEQVYQKAKFAFGDDADFIKIQNL